VVTAADELARPDTVEPAAGDERPEREEPAERSEG
jgi:hypothetical protein